MPKSGSTYCITAIGSTNLESKTCEKTSVDKSYEYATDATVADFTERRLINDQA